MNKELWVYLAIGMMSVWAIGMIYCFIRFLIKKTKWETSAIQFRKEIKPGDKVFNGYTISRIVDDKTVIVEKEINIESIYPPDGYPD